MVGTLTRRSVNPKDLFITYTVIIAGFFLWKFSEFADYRWSLVERRVFNQTITVLERRNSHFCYLSQVKWEWSCVKFVWDCCLPMYMYLRFLFPSLCLSEGCPVLVVYRFHANIWPMLGEPLWINKGLLAVWWTQWS